MIRIGREIQCLPNAGFLYKIIGSQWEGQQGKSLLWKLVLNEMIGSQCNWRSQEGNIMLSMGISV